MHQEALRRSCIKTGKPALVDAVTQHRSGQKSCSRKSPGADNAD
jgi:hypothetical protein